MMISFGLLRPKMLLRSCRGARQRSSRGVSNFIVVEHDEDEWRNVSDDSKKAMWIPHPRTGIYYPKGSERVMDDVPDHASLKQPYWFRSEAADKPDPDDYSLDSAY